MTDHSNLSFVIRVCIIDLMLPALVTMWNVIKGFLILKNFSRVGRILLDGLIMKFDNHLQ